MWLSLAFALAAFPINLIESRYFGEPANTFLGRYARAAVATDNIYCSEIGRDILLRGGNAVDAAIAALVCIGVMDPQSAGLGGGHFMNIYNAKTHECHGVTAREKAPAAAHRNMFAKKDEWINAIKGWKAMAVPGELHGLWTEYMRFGSGKIKWKELLQPTIDLMAPGYPVSHLTAAALQELRQKVLYEPSMRKTFVNPETNDVYKAGELIKTRARLRETLQRLADSPDPVKLFYNGELTQGMVKEFRDNGGLLTLDDFRQYSPIVYESKHMIYTDLKGGRRICGLPPPCGCATTQSLLNILDQYNWDNTSLTKRLSKTIHRFIEAGKYAYLARERFADPNADNKGAAGARIRKLARMINTKAYAKSKRLEMDRSGSRVTQREHFSLALVPEDHGTTHISIVDPDGNAVSVTSTINLIFGAQVVSQSTGILWNDQMDDFSIPGRPNGFGLPPSEINYASPGKRPQSSTSPLIIFHPSDGSQELMVVGAAGGSKIISTTAYVAFRTLWLGQTVKEAIDAKRFHNQMYPYNVFFETPPISEDLIRHLYDYGHNMTQQDDTRVNEVSIATAIHRPNATVLFAATDYRNDAESGPAGF